MHRHSQRLIAFAFLTIVDAGTACADFADYRSIFIDRFDFVYNSGNIPQMVSAINTQMQNAAGRRFHRSHLASSRPGRRTLQQQLRAAGHRPDARLRSAANRHRRGPRARPQAARLDQRHAACGTRPRVNPPAGHIFHNTNPSFRLMDINGNLEPQAGWSNYSSVNPVLPEVHAHINNVVNDIATNYAVDGIHLDYIRYLPGANNAAADFAQMPHDPIAHQMFKLRPIPTVPAVRNGLDAATSPTSPPTRTTSPAASPTSCGRSRTPSTPPK